MATNYVDQITGSGPSPAPVDPVTGAGETVAYKAPCRLATTGNITLSGLQTVDGVTTAADDRVLVRAQDDASANGIWIAQSGAWFRTRDMDSNRDLTRGTRVTVTDGSTLAGKEYAVTSANPIALGTDDITFAETLSSQAGAFVKDTDGTMAANSDAVVPSQKAVVTYVAAQIAAAIAALKDGVSTAFDTLKKLADGLALKVDKAGDTLSGFLTLHADPSSAMHAVTKQYADGLAANLGKRQRVRAATTGNITISTALNNGDALDGVTLATGDLVLVKDQSTANENGVYVVGVTPVRAAEFDTYDEHPGSLIAVQEGTINADTIFLCTSNVGGTLNTTSIEFALFQTSGGWTWQSIALSGAASRDITVPTSAIEIVAVIVGGSSGSTARGDIQLGDSGGIESTGYSAFAMNAGGENKVTSGFPLGSGTTAAAGTLDGYIHMHKVSSLNTWMGMIGGYDSAALPSAGFGSKTLSDAITTVRAIASAGNWDAGTFYVGYK